MSLCHQSLEELHSVAADWRFPPRARRSIFKSEDEMCTSKMNVGWNNMKHDLLRVLPQVQSSFSDFLTDLFRIHHLLNIFSVPSKSSKFQPAGCGIIQCMKHQIQFHCTFVLHDFEMFWGRLITPKDCWILNQHSERKVSQTFRKPAGHRVSPSTYPPNIECKRYSSCLEVGVPFLSRFPKPSQIPGQICSFEWGQFAKTC